jgi:hypothetical protein
MSQFYRFCALNEQVMVSLGFRCRIIIMNTDLSPASQEVNFILLFLGIIAVSYILWNRYVFTKISLFYTILH